MTIRQKQHLLAYLGYYVGVVDGDWGQLSKTACKAFQKDYGLEETGVVNGETEALLMSAEYRVLRYGLDGDDVKRLTFSISPRRSFAVSAAVATVTATLPRST